MFAKLAGIFKDRAVALALVSIIASAAAVLGFDLGDAVQGALISVITFLGGYLGGKVSPQPEALLPK